jgi:hypothetical protein
MADENDINGADGADKKGKKAKDLVKVIAKRGMWRGGVSWQAGLNEIETAVLAGKIEGTKKTVRDLLEEDAGGNFTIL